MKVSTLLLISIGAQGGLSHPGMVRTIRELEKYAKLEARGGSLSTELIGDIATLPDSQLTQVGKDVKAILTGQLSAESSTLSVNPPAAVTSSACKADTCCVWGHIAKDMETLFRGDGGLCTKLARQAVRFGFHDAGTWSKSAGDGGADGSLLMFADELNRFGNSVMQPIADEYKKLYKRYHDDLGFSAITNADLVQVGATVATVVCPLGPRIKTYVGRKDATGPNPAGRLPSPLADAPSLITLFADKTVTTRSLVVLLGAHTVSRQTIVNTTLPDAPQDSTPGVWDTAYFSQTRGGQQAAPNGVVLFPSDNNLAQYHETYHIFDEFATQQTVWNREYAREYVRMSLMGVNNINSMTDCTKWLPKATTSFTAKTK